MRFFFLVFTVLIIYGCQVKSCIQEFTTYKDYAGEFKFSVPDNYSKRTSFDPVETVFFLYDEGHCIQSIALNTFRDDILNFEKEVSELKKQLPIVGESFHIEEITINCRPPIDSLFVVKEFIKKDTLFNYLVFFKTQGCQNSFSFSITVRPSMKEKDVKKLINQLLCDFRCLSNLDDKNK